MERVVELNALIESSVCKDTLCALSDKSLLNKYKETQSLGKKITSLRQVLKDNDIETDKINKILEEFVMSLVPPGTKGVIRGNMFNKIVKDKILSFNLDPSKYDIKFENKHDKIVTSEIPDWYIENKQNNKVLIGMNQVDLWNGGQQLNRGFKYLINNSIDNSHCQLICVVANPITLKTNKSKAFQLFDKTFESGKMCYLTQLQNTIQKFIT
jgi:hypothetical protein